MPKFKSGDLIYSQDESGYRPGKILAVDSVQTDGGLWECYHMSAYQPTPAPPTAETAAELKLFIMHFPVDPAAIDSDYHFAANIPVTRDELEGFHTYLRMTDFPRYLSETGQDIDKVVEEAGHHYRTGCAAHDKRMLDEAMEHYTRAYEIFPYLFEAIDNKGFALMELGRFEEAADQFRASLEVNEDGTTAYFSLGECLLKLNRPAEALPYFEEGARRWPEKREFQTFLERTRNMLNKDHT